MEEGDIQVRGKDISWENFGCVTIWANVLSLCPQS